VDRIDGRRSVGDTAEVRRLVSAVAHCSTPPAEN
jgi:hypothetical protein